MSECKESNGCPAWIRTTVNSSKGCCPTIRRRGIIFLNVQNLAPNVDVFDRRGSVFYLLCRREDLNLHTLRHTHLKRTCIPISPRRQFVKRALYYSNKKLLWPLRDSNPRPPRCKRDALPTELSSQLTYFTSKREI